MDGAVHRLRGPTYTGRFDWRTGRGILLTVAATLFFLFAIPTVHATGNPALSAFATTVDSLQAAGAYGRADDLARAGLKRARQELDPTSLDLADWLNRAGRSAFSAGDLDTAQSHFARAQDIAEPKGQAGRLVALCALRGLRDVAIDRSDVEPAHELAARCLDEGERIYGAGSPELAEDVTALAGAHLMQDQVGDAEELLAAATLRIESTWGPDHPQLGILLQESALLALRRGQFAEAKERYDRAIALHETRMGPDHPDLTAALSGLAIVLRRQGDFTAARDLYERCLRIRTRAYGPDHPRVATTLHNLGVLLDHIGEVDEGVDLLTRCLEIREKAYGEENAEVALTLITLSSALNIQGKQAESVLACRRAVAITEEVLGETHTQTARALLRLAHILQQQGNHAEAEGLLQRGYDITESIYGSPHPELASYLASMSWCQHVLGRQEEAQANAQRAIENAVAVYGPDHYKVALQKRDLARILLERRQTSEARSLLVECERIFAGALGEDHAALVRIHTGLAWAALQEDDIQQARHHAARAIEVSRASHGELNLGEVGILQLAAVISHFAGDHEESIELARQAARLALAFQTEIYPVSSESEALSYAQMPLQAARLLMGLVAEAPSPEAFMEITFSYLASTHGKVLDRMAQRQRLRDFCTRVDPELCMSWDRYRAVAQRLANLVVRGPRGRTADYREQLAQARSEKEAAERALAEASARLSRPSPAGAAAALSLTSELAALLEPNARLIQFVHYPGLDFAWQAWERNARSPKLWSFGEQNARYAAFCLSRGDEGSGPSLRFVDLGAAAGIDSLILAYRQAIDAVDAGRRPTAREEAEYRQAARHLHARLWAPLADRSGALPVAARDASPPLTLVIPAARLHLIDFGTLLDEEERPVIETERIHWLSSARDLARLADPAGVSRGVGLLAVGNPRRPQTEIEMFSPTASAQRDAAESLCSEAYRELGPLPAAEDEVRAAEELFTHHRSSPATVLLGTDAREDTIKEQMIGRRILHFATHGFFCPAAGSGGSESETIEENPLLSSGLILAPTPDEEDGLLTALELTGQDLYGTDWVVLSACGSGLGRIQLGEGMCGLRRAFEMAGARTVIMALWRIDDRVASDLIVRIYRHRLGGATTVDAVRNAALDRMREQQDRTGRLHPAAWGGVISEGDWR